MLQKVKDRQDGGQDSVDSSAQSLLVLPLFFAKVDKTVISADVPGSNGRMLAGCQIGWSDASQTCF